MRKEIQNVMSAIKSAGIDCSYNRWPEDGAKIPHAYATLQLTNSSNFISDDVVYQHIYNMELDFFSSKKDIDSEEKIMAALDSLCIPYQSHEYYITSSKIYQIQYIFDVVELLN